MMARRQFNARRRGAAAAASAALSLSAALLLIVAPAVAQPQSAPQTPLLRDWSHAVFGELAASFVPVANDVPLMVGVGVRVANIHEVWARIGYIPVGDDGQHAFGVLGYRVALRPGRVVRPVLGGFFAGLPASCGHDPQGRPVCTPDRLFIISTSGGVRIEPVPWFGIAGLLHLGMDTFPNPFGMVELATTFTLPL